MELSRSLRLVRSSQWAVVHEESGRPHVIPVDDIFPHMESVKCVCKPVRVPADETHRETIMHNSFDEREAYEPHRLFG